MSEIKAAHKSELPQKLYVDTTFFVDVIIETAKNKRIHNLALNFAERIYNSKTTIITSKFALIEYWNAVSGIKIEALTGDRKRGLSKIIGKKKLEEELFAWTKAQYDKLMNFLETWTRRPDIDIKESVGLVAVPKDIHDQARTIAFKYKLPVYDAIHFYTMKQTSTTFIITNNVTDFGHLKNITVLTYF